MRDNKEAQTSFLLLQAIPVKGPRGNVPTLTFETVFRACVKYHCAIPERVLQRHVECHRYGV